MGAETILIGLVLLCGFYVAWNIGANDVANAMGTSVGSGALTLRNAVILAAIFEFSGAFIVGSNVSKTVRKGIFDPGKLVQKSTLALPPNLSAIKPLVDKNALVKENAPVLECTTESGLVTINAPADGHFSVYDIKGVAEDAVLQHNYAIEINRKYSSIVLGCGMIAALLAAGTWLLIATWMSWPVSTTHSIVGAVVGFGCVALGTDGVAWEKVGFIASGWLVSPLISGAIAYIVFGILLRTVFHKRDPVSAARRVAPKLVFFLMFVMTGMTCYKGLKPLWSNWKMDPKDPSFMLSVAAVACLIGFIGYLITKHSVRNLKKAGPSDSDAEAETGKGRSNPLLDAEVSRSLSKTIKHLQRVRNHSEGEMENKVAALLSEAESLQEQALNQIDSGTDSVELQQVEKVFSVLQILTACLVAFAHGSNDVANAIGPLSAAYQAIQNGMIAAKSTTPLWALGLGGIGIVIGLWTWGWKVIKTVGEKITELTPSRGFCAEFAAAITILLASVLPFGLPISTTHTLVGAVLGVGLARGIGALNLKTMREIVAGWIITIPAGAGLCVLFYFVLKMIFIDSGWAV